MRFASHRRLFRVGVSKKAFDYFLPFPFAVMALTCVKSGTEGGAGKNPGSPSQKGGHGLEKPQNN